MNLLIEKCQSILRLILCILFFTPLIFSYGCSESQRDKAMKENHEILERELPTLQQNLITKRYKEPVESLTKLGKPELDEVDKLELALQKEGKPDPVLDD